MAITHLLITDLPATQTQHFALQLLSFNRLNTAPSHSAAPHLPAHERPGFAHSPDYSTDLSTALRADGVPLFGYTWWGSIDVVSAGTAQMSKRYGFICVNQNDMGNGTQKRTLKKRYHWYKKLIASNGEDMSH